MSFMPSKPAFQQAISGSLEADILIISPNPDQYAIRNNKPIGHGAETVLQSCLHSAGLIVQEVCTTSFIYDQVDISKLWRKDGAKGASQVKGDLSGYKQTLWALIKQVNPKVIVSLGDITSYVLTGHSEITKVRGYPFKLADTGIWVIPSLDPHMMVWGNYEWRYYLSHDLKKAREIIADPTFAWPKHNIRIVDNIISAVNTLNFLKSQSKLAFDIEVANFHTSCIGFSESWSNSYVFPIDMRWTEEEEWRIWTGVASILGNQNITKITQNGVFDVQFLVQELGIFTRGRVEDTMIAHSIMYPDFLKSLGFIASIHTYHPYWKDELDFKSIKADD